MGLAARGIDDINSFLGERFHEKYGGSNLIGYGVSALSIFQCTSGRIAADH
jgi:hypothetical protein